MTRSQELLNAIIALNAAAKAFAEKGESEKYQSTMADIKAKREEYEAAKAEEETEKFIAEQQAEKAKPVEGKPEKAAEPEKETSEKALARAARAGFVDYKAMSEGSNANGGYTVPVDIVTRAYELRDAKENLLQYVRQSNVTTNAGERTFKKRSNQTGFAPVGEHGDIEVNDTPQYDRLSYNIQKYAGIYEMTEELLEDSDENIVRDIVEWAGNELRVTVNKKILSTISTNDEWKTPTALVNLDGIMKALNVTLGQAFKNTSRIFTNDDGYQWLCTLKDNNARYLLTPDPTNPAAQRLAVGAMAVPITVIPNADMPTDSTNQRIPFLIGDLKEAIWFFDRKSLTLKQSDVAVVGNSNAFRQDLTFVRAITRFDCVARDTAALVNGYIPVG